GDVLVLDRRDELALLALDERARKVLLDGELLAAGILGQIDDREPAAGDAPYDTIATDLQPIGQRGIGLRSHPPDFKGLSTAEANQWPKRRGHTASRA